MKTPTVTPPTSSFSFKEKKNITPYKKTLKSQRSLPNIEEGKPKPYSKKSRVARRSRIKSFEGKKVDLTPVGAKVDPMTPTSSLSLSLSSLSLEKESECKKKLSFDSMDE